MTGLVAKGGATEPGATEPTPQPSSSSAPWLSTALRAWDDTRAALMNLDRDISSIEPDSRSVPRAVRAALDAMRRADRTRPSWVELSGGELGDEPRDPTWTERQLERTRAQARRLRAELERAEAALRDAARTEGPTSPYARVLQMSEQAATTILRPLSLAVATATRPLQQGAGAGLALGLLAAAFLLTR